MTNPVTDKIDGQIMTAEDFFNEAKKWADGVRSAAKANAAAFGKGKKESYHTYKERSYKAGYEEPKLKNAMSYKIRKKGGEVSSIGLVLPRHGIYRAFGVGRGQPAEGSGKKQSHKVFIKRSMSDWLNKPIDDHLEKLAAAAAEYYGDKVLSSVYGMGNRSKIQNL